jgi:hypothetical protein
MSNYPASQKQMDFVNRLLGERDTTGTKFAAFFTAPALTKTQASEAITALLALPKKSDTAPAEPEAGVYVYAGDQYARVYLGQQSGHMLAKRINFEQDGDDWTVSYEYLGAAAKVLTPDTTPTRLTLDEVAGLGVTTNHCMMCGRRLDDPESVDRGIGPVCARQYDAPEQETPVLEEDATALREATEALCSPGQKCDAYRLCSKHSMSYQNRYGRAYSE